jgi:hypothetical protein
VAQHLVDAAARSVQLGLRDLLRDQVLAAPRAAESHLRRWKSEMAPPPSFTIRPSLEVGRKATGRGRWMGCRFRESNARHLRPVYLLVFQTRSLSRHSLRSSNGTGRLAGAVQNASANLRQQFE